MENPTHETRNLFQLSFSHNVTSNQAIKIQYGQSESFNCEASVALSPPGTYKMWLLDTRLYSKVAGLRNLLYKEKSTGI